MRTAAIGFLIIWCSSIMVPPLLGQEDRKAPASWEGLSATEFADQAVTISCSAESRAAKAPPAALVEFAWKNYLSTSDQLSQIDASTMFEILAVVTPSLSQAQRHQLVSSYYQKLFSESAKAPVSSEDLVLLGWCMLKAGDWSPPEGQQKYLSAVIAHATSSEFFSDDVTRLQRRLSSRSLAQDIAFETYLNPFWHQQFRKTIDDKACSFYEALFSDSLAMKDYAASYFYGRALRDDASRDALMKQLLDEQGRPRMGVAKVVMFAYRAANKLSDLDKIADAKSNDAALDGDARALWYLIGAHIHEVKDFGPLPPSGRRRMEQSIAAAEHDATRFTCLRTLAVSLSSVSRHDEARSLIAGTTFSTMTDSLVASRDQLLEALSEERQLYDRARILHGQAAKLDRLQIQAQALQRHAEILQSQGEPRTEDLKKVQRSEAEVKNRIDEMLKQ